LKSFLEIFSICFFYVLFVFFFNVILFIFFISPTTLMYLRITNKQVTHDNQKKKT
jgi:hypothetical protein